MGTGIDRIGALSKAFEFVYKSEIEGDFYEFGVYQGVSLARAIKANLVWQKRTSATYVKRYFGFDSFQGLPAFAEKDLLRDYRVFQEGQFGDTSVEQVRENIMEAAMPLDGVELVTGLFSSSLSAADVMARIGGSRVAIAHVDCDLYSSAIDCLEFIGNRLQDGAVILFDDWFCYRGRPTHGVHKAFMEWIQETGYLASDYFTYSWAGKAFIISLPDEI